MGKLNAKLNLTIRAVGNQLVPALRGVAFTRAKMSKPRHYGEHVMLKRLRTSSST